MSNRPDQVGSVLQRAIQSVISKGFQDPRISGLITVTAVTVSNDLRNATVLLSVIPEEREELTMHGIKSATKYIRHKASDLVALRHMPELVFKIDKGLKRQAEVFRALAVSEAEQREQAANDAETDAETDVEMTKPTHLSPTDSSPTDSANEAS